METYIVIIIAISFGIGIVAFEKWYSIKRTRKTKKQVTDKLTQQGFEKSKTQWEFQKTINKYSVNITLLPKTNFFSIHGIRFAVSFNLEWEFNEVENELRVLRNKYTNYRFVTNFITTDISFFKLSNKVFKKLDNKINQSIEILKKEGLKPIEEVIGDKQGNNYESWSIKN